MTAKKTPAKKTAKKKTKKKTTRKKRIVKAPVNGTTLRKAREQAFKKDFNHTSQWPWPLRPRQQMAWDAMERGIDRLSLNWHRRFGKDVFAMSVARNKMRHRIGTYVHFFPKHVHAKRALWRGIDPRKGAKFIDIAFGDIEVDRNNQDMFIEAYNGSMWNLLGSDNYDSNVVGGNIVGVCFSEWALCDPRAWDYVRPILLENGGWAMFITTFRGRNHAWQMAQNNKDNPEWYVDIAGVDKTTDIEGNPIITPEMIESERRSGMSEAIIQQEYYCNPQATADGAIYGSQVDHLRNDPRRNLAEWNPGKPVYCVWNFDLPVFGAFFMVQPGDIPQVIDCGIVEWKTLGEMLAETAKRRWPIQRHMIMPDQLEVSTLFTDLGYYAEALPERPPYQVVTHTQNLLETVRIDGGECEQLLDALGGYVRRERFDMQASDLQFSEEALTSWHWRLARPLEVFASSDYSRADEWGSPPDYSEQDRITRIVR